MFGDTLKILAESELAIVTSGTATLEAALLGTKQVIAYKTSALNYLIAKALVKVKHIGLPNLILGREIVPELIQSDCISSKIIEQLYFYVFFGPKISFFWSFLGLNFMLHHRFFF